MGWETEPEVSEAEAKHETVNAGGGDVEMQKEGVEKGDGETAEEERDRLVRRHHHHARKPRFSAIPFVRCAHVLRTGLRRV